jgi:hypothetical protein
MAGIVEPNRIKAVAALGGLDSIESLSEGIGESHSQQMLPGMLRWFDEADLAAALGPKPTLLAGVTNKHGNLLSSDRLDQRYKWTRIRFRRLQETDALRLVSGMPSQQSLAQWIKSLK